MIGWRLAVGGWQLAVPQLRAGLYVGITRKRVAVIAIGTLSSVDCDAALRHDAAIPPTANRMCHRKRVGRSGAGIHSSMASSRSASHALPYAFDAGQAVAPWR